MLHHAVGEVAVHHPQPPAVEQAVLGLAADRDVAEVQAAERADRLVVVAGHEDDVRSLARLAQHLLDDVVVRLVPEEAALHRPAVDDVADQVQPGRLVVAQEVEQVLGLAAGGAQVDVGDEDRPVLHRCVGRVAKRRGHPGERAAARRAQGDVIAGRAAAAYIVGAHLTAGA